MNKILVLLLLVAALFAVPMTVGASELSDYNYLVAHQDNARNIQMLNDLAYHTAGSMDRMDVRVDNIVNDKMMHVNMYWKYNPLTGNLDWTGYFRSSN